METYLCKKQKSLSPEYMMYLYCLRRWRNMIITDLLWKV